MNEYAFRALIELVQFDQAIDAIQQNINKINQDIQLLREQKQQSQQEAEAAKVAFFNARKLVDEQELAMKELDGQERHAKERLDTVANQKEYKALQAEIAQLQQSQRDLEDVVMDAWNKRDTAEKEYERLQKSNEAKAAELRTAIVAKQAEVVVLEEQVDEQKKGREAKVAPVPEEWREKYTTMGARVTNPVVAIVGDACNECSQQLTKQDLLRLKRGALLQCKGCFRFLYDSAVVENN